MFTLGLSPQALLLTTPLFPKLEAELASADSTGAGGPAGYSSDLGPGRLRETPGVSAVTEPVQLPQGESCVSDLGQEAEVAGSESLTSVGAEGCGDSAPGTVDLCRES